MRRGSKHRLESFVGSKGFVYFIFCDSNLDQNNIVSVNPSFPPHYVHEFVGS